jgi:hypothetical protein
VIFLKVVLKADSFDQAVALTKDCPHIANEGNIEVREIAPVPVM